MFSGNPLTKLEYSYASLSLALTCSGLAPRTPPDIASHIISLVISMPLMFVFRGATIK